MNEELTCHSEGAEIRAANERLRNPLKIGRPLRATNYQGIPHIVFSASQKKSEPALSEGNVFGMTRINVTK